MTQTSPYTQRPRRNPAGQQQDFANQQPQQPAPPSGSGAAAPYPMAQQPYRMDQWGDRGTIYRPQVQDQWNQSPGNPNYRQPPQPQQQQPAAPAPIQRQEWTRQNVREALSKFAPTREGLDQAIAANPWLGKQVGNQGGKIQDPQTGAIWDVIGNLASGNGHWQTLTGNTARMRAQQGGGGGAPMATVAANPTVGGPAGPAPSYGGAPAAAQGVGDLPTYTPHEFAPRDIGELTYQPGQIDQFNAPDFSQFEGGQDALINKILGNPESMGADTVNQMRASQSGAMAQMLQDAQARMQQGAVRRGAIGGLGVGERRLNEAAMSDLLGGFRDIDIEAAKTNFGDRINALGAVDDSLSRRTARDVLGYDATLRGQMSREGNQQAAAQSALAANQFDFNRELAQVDENRFGFGAEADKVKFQLQKALGLGGLDLQGRQLGLEGQRLNEMMRQFNLTFPESQRQFNAQMGYNWGALGANQQAQLISTLLR